jgi:hypothetical protein
MPEQRFYDPVPRGLEARIADRLAELRAATERRRAASTGPAATPDSDRR